MPTLLPVLEGSDLPQLGLYLHSLGDGSVKQDHFHPNTCDAVARHPDDYWAVR